MTPRPAPAGYPWIPALLTMLAVLAVLWTRQPDQFARPQLRAEDGQVFFVQADAMGPAATVLPYNGYHHLWLRLIAGAAAPLPARWIPLAYFGASLLTLALLVLALFSPRLELPRKPWLALALVALPQTGEVFGNLSNTLWLAAVGLVVLLLANDPARRRVQFVDGAMAALLGLTGIFSVLFAPLFLLRAYWRRSAASLSLAASVCLAAAVQLHALTHSPSAIVNSGAPGLFDLTRILGLRLWAALALPAAAAEHLPPLVLIVGGLAATAVALATSLRPRNDRATHLLLWGALFAVLAGTAYRFRGDLGQLNGLGNGDRYFFLPKVVLVWLLILWWENSSRWRWVPRLGCALALFAAGSAWRFERYRDLDWPTWAEKLDTGQRLVVPINPGEMTFTHPGRPPR